MWINGGGQHWETELWCTVNSVGTQLIRHSSNASGVEVKEGQRVKL